MSSLIFWRNVLVTGFCAAYMAACTPKEAVSPTSTAPLSVADARAWYDATHQLKRAENKTSGADSTRTEPWSLDWNRARMLTGIRPLVVVPFKGDGKLFSGRSVQGTRSIVIEWQPQSGRPTGLIIELLLKRSTNPVDTVALFADLYRSFRNGAAAVPTQGIGQVLFYSDAYHYRTGRRFENGVICTTPQKLDSLAGHVK